MYILIKKYKNAITALGIVLGKMIGMSIFKIEPKISILARDLRLFFRSILGR